MSVRGFLWRKWTEPFHRITDFEIGVIVGICIGAATIGIIWGVN
jgi:hypothetical protein